MTPRVRRCALVCMCLLLPVSALRAAEKVTIARDGAEVVVGKAVLSILNKGATVEVVKREGVWVGVRIGDKTGWVHRRDLAEATRPDVKERWLEGNAPAAAGPAAAPAGPKEWETLLGEAQVIGRAKVTPIRVNAKRTKPCMEWSADGKFLYLLEADTWGDRARLSKVAVPEFREVKTLDFGASRLTILHCSAVGLVAAGTDAKRKGGLWVISEDDLTLQREVELEAEISDSDVMTSRGLSVAYVKGSLRPPDGSSSRGVHVFFLKDGKRVAGYTEEDLSKVATRETKGAHNNGAVGRCHVTFDLAAATPDGKYLLSVNSNRVQRLKLSGAGIQFDDITLSVVKGARPVLSPDGKYFAVAADPDQRQLAPGYPKMPVGFYICQVTDIQKPVSMIRGVIGALAFDPPARRIYAYGRDAVIPGDRRISNDPAKLMVYAPDGTQAEAFELDKNETYARQLLVHPSGGKMLILTDKQLLWVELQAGPQ